MAEIVGVYWQILDRSGKKIIPLSPLYICKISEAAHIHMLDLSHSCKILQIHQTYEHEPGKFLYKIVYIALHASPPAVVLILVIAMVILLE